MKLHVDMCGDKLAEMCGDNMRRYHDLQHCLDMCDRLMGEMYLSSESLGFRMKESSAWSYVIEFPESIITAYESMLAVVFEL